MKNASLFGVTFGLIMLFLVLFAISHFAFLVPFVINHFAPVPSREISQTTPKVRISG